MAIDAPTERLMTDCRIRLPGLAESALRHEMFAAYREFFAGCDAWQVDLGFGVATGRSSNAINPNFGRVNRLIGVLQDGRFMRGAVLEQVDGVDFVNIGYVASSALKFIARVSLTVEDPTNADSLPIVPGPLVERYSDDIMNGILSRMMSQPSKPYTNTALAAYHAMKFKSGISRARNEVFSQKTRGSQVWAFPQTFNRRK